MKDRTEIDRAMDIEGGRGKGRERGKRKEKERERERERGWLTFPCSVKTTAERVKLSDKE